MAAGERDVDKSYTVEQFVAKLRRLADALEAGRPFRVQVAGERFTVPGHARISVEHERSSDEEELEFQLTWTAAEADAAEPDDGDDV